MLRSQNKSTRRRNVLFILYQIKGATCHRSNTLNSTLLCFSSLTPVRFRNLVLGEKCETRDVVLLIPTSPRHTSLLLLSRVIWLFTQLLLVMSAMLLCRISHATGWSGMWMTAYQELSTKAYTPVPLKKKGVSSSRWALTAIPQVW